MLAPNTTFNTRASRSTSASLGASLRRATCSREAPAAVTAASAYRPAYRHRDWQPIWADRYDREMADIFLVQDEIVNQIVAMTAGSYGAIERNETRSPRAES